MRGYRVFDVIEDRYSDKEFFIDKDGVLFKVGNTDLNSCDFMVQLEEADPSRYIVEEGTGLKDKNDKMIFEGDVLIRSSSILKQSFKNRIVFDKGCFCIRTQDIQTKEWINGDLGSYTEDESIAKYELVVIGNIHDNPELLEVTE